MTSCQQCFRSQGWSLFSGSTVLQKGTALNAFVNGEWQLGFMLFLALYTKKTRIIIIKENGVNLHKELDEKKKQV